MPGYPFLYVMEKTLVHFMVKGDEPFIKDLFKAARNEKADSGTTLRLLFTVLQIMKRILQNITNPKTKTKQTKQTKSNIIKSNQTSRLRVTF